MRLPGQKKMNSRPPVTTKNSSQFACFLDSAPKILHFLGMCFPGAISFRFSVDSWTPGEAKTMENYEKTKQSRFHPFRKSMVPGSNLVPFWSHFRDLWAPKFHLFVIFRGFIFRFKSHAFWNPKGIEKY